MQTLMYGSNVLFRPLSADVMSYSDPYVRSNVLFRPLCMAVMSYSDPYVWL